VDAAASGARGAGRAGCPRELVATRGRTALTGSSRRSGWRQRAQRRQSGAAGESEPRVRPNRVVLTVVATVKPRWMRMSRQPARPSVISAGVREARRTFGSRESAVYAVQPSRREGRVSGHTCMLLCGSSCVCIRAADRGCRSAPGLPCALLAKRVETNAKLGCRAPRDRAGAPTLERRCSDVL
jgi:hypothetical protein